MIHEAIANQYTIHGSQMTNKSLSRRGIKHAVQFDKGGARDIVLTVFNHYQNALTHTPPVQKPNDQLIEYRQTRFE